MIRKNLKRINLKIDIFILYIYIYIYIFVILNASFECRKLRLYHLIHRTLLLIRLTYIHIRTYWLCLGEHLMTFLKLLRAILPADRDAVSWRVYDTP